MITIPIARKRSNTAKNIDDIVAAVGRGLKRAAKVARKTAKMHSAPVVIMKDGKIVLEKP